MIGVLLRRLRKNPLLAAGLSLFVITFGFVSYNAFSRQRSVQRSVFFPTRADRGWPAAFAWQNHGSPNRNAGDSAGARQAAVIRDNDPDLKAMQKKLADLGLYSGKIDGLSGPQTREAIQKWQELQKGLLKKQTGSVR